MYWYRWEVGRDVVSACISDDINKCVTKREDLW